MGGIVVDGDGDGVGGTGGADSEGDDDDDTVDADTSDTADRRINSLSTSPSDARANARCVSEVSVSQPSYAGQRYSSSQR